MAERDRSARGQRDGSVGGDEMDAVVMRIAARLFGELGYDALPLQVVADAVGVGTEMLVARYGGKSGLYVLVMRWTRQQHRDHMEEPRRSYTPDTQGLTRFLDRHLEYCLEHPELARLLIQRWMSDASDIASVDEDVVIPTMREGIELTRLAVRADVDPQAAAETLSWSIHGYLQAGYLDDAGRRRPPEDPEMLARFRRHLHWLIEKMTTPD